MDNYTTVDMNNFRQRRHSSPEFTFSFPVNSKIHLKFAREWADVTMDFFTRCMKLEEQRSALEKDIVETMQFSMNAKLPYNWEALRTDYVANFQNMLTHVVDIKTLLDSVPYSIQFYQEQVLNSLDSDYNNNAKNNLEFALQSLADSLADLSTDFQTEKKDGLRAFTASQQVPKPCGF
jgi:hypothetical protein